MNELLPSICTYKVNYQIKTQIPIGSYYYNNNTFVTSNTRNQHSQVIANLSRKNRIDLEK